MQSLGKAVQQNPLQALDIQELVQERRHEQKRHTASWSAESEQRAEVRQAARAEQQAETERG